MLLGAVAGGGGGGTESRGHGDRPPPRLSPPVFPSVPPTPALPWRCTFPRHPDDTFPTPHHGRKVQRRT